MAGKAPRNLRAHNTRVLIVEEADGMEMTAMSSPIALAEKCTLSFPDGAPEPVQRRHSSGELTSFTKLKGTEHAQLRHRGERPCLARTLVRDPMLALVDACHSEWARLRLIPRDIPADEPQPVWDRLNSGDELPTATTTSGAAYALHLALELDGNYANLDGVSELIRSALRWIVAHHEADPPLPDISRSVITDPNGRA